MDPERERQLIELAVRSGALTEADVSGAATVPVRSGGSVFDRLIAAGRIDASTVSALSATLDSQRVPPIEDWERYRIVDFLGGGGMGSVFKAFDPELNRHVAVKFIRGANPALVERFKREARTQASVDHDRICKVYEVGEVEGHPYIAMQYIAGEPLGRAARNMTLEQKLLVIRQIAEGLHAAHRVGLIHRDIKPGNIMVSQDAHGRWLPYLMDFGLAREPGSPELTRTGAVIGTPRYMSPEQASGETRRIDRRSDVYSLGAALYEVVAGQPPFAGRSIGSVFRSVVEELPDDLRSLDATIPRDVDAITLKCLRKNPDERYASARALADDVGRFLDGQPIEARPTTLFYRLKMKAARHRAATAVVSVAVVLAVAAAVWGSYSAWNASRRAAVAREFGQQVDGSDRPGD